MPSACSEGSAARSLHTTKVSCHVPFPLALELGPYATSRPPPKGVRDLEGDGGGGSGSDEKYELFAIVEHSGSFSGGHYTAFVRSRGAGGDAWRHISDTHVSEASEADALGAQAFLLLYKRVGAD